MKFSLLFWLLLSSISLYSQDFPFDRVKKNIINSYLMNDSNLCELRTKVSELENDANPSDQVISELFQKKIPNYKLAQFLIDSLKPNGSWNQINYNDTKKSGWEPKQHAEYILFLSKVYSVPNSPFFKNPKLSKTIHQALNFWFVRKLICSNWWYNEIGIPKTIGPVLLILENEL